MFSTCIFCNRALGANEALEQFPVGRRIAFDAEKGRLWVVCGSCERWNLSPLETRWEAIEEAEKAFGETRMRVSGENIGMAQLPDGLELVRIGAAKRPEFAAWRYGDQFGRRRRRNRWLGFAILGTTFPMLGISGAHLLATMLSPALAAALATWSSVAGAVSVGGTFAGYGALQLFTLNEVHVPRFSVRDNNASVLRLTRYSAKRARLFPATRDSEWHLALPHVSVKPSHGVLKRLGHREMAVDTNAIATLTGDAATSALGVILPTVNQLGGNKRMVQDAVNAIQDATGVQQLLRHGGFPDQQRVHVAPDADNRHLLYDFEPHFRLALEMTLHEGDERRAMEGELHVLEQRWRDADAIAKIADEMFLRDATVEETPR